MCSAACELAAQRLGAKLGTPEVALERFGAAQATASETGRTKAVAAPDQAPSAYAAGDDKTPIMLSHVKVCYFHTYFHASRMACALQPTTSCVWPLLLRLVCPSGLALCFHRSSMCAPDPTGVPFHRSHIAEECFFALQEKDPAELAAQADRDAELALQTAAALRAGANPGAVEGYVPRGRRMPSPSSLTAAAGAKGRTSKAGEALVAPTALAETSAVSGTVGAGAGKAATGHRTPAEEDDAPQPHTESNARAPAESYVEIQSSSVATSSQQELGAPASGREAPDNTKAWECGRSGGPDELFLASSSRVEHGSVAPQNVQAELTTAADEAAEGIRPLLGNAADVSTPQQPVLVGAFI